jgi:hypothetical protein
MQCVFKAKTFISLKSKAVNSSEPADFDEWWRRKNLLMITYSVHIEARPVQTHSIFSSPVQQGDSCFVIIIAVFLEQYKR